MARPRPARRRVSGGNAADSAHMIAVNDPEIDLVGADRGPVARRVTFVGSITWQEQRPFDAHDLARLLQHRDRMPGADDDTPLVAVSRSGATVDGLAVLQPSDLLPAYRQPAGGTDGAGPSG